MKKKMKYSAPALLAIAENYLALVCKSGSTPSGDARPFSACYANGSDAEVCASNGQAPGLYESSGQCVAGNSDSGDESYCGNGPSNPGNKFSSCVNGGGFVDT